MESRNFQTRKTVLEYDDVMNTQRKVIYEQRRKVLDGENLKESVQAMLSTVISTEVQAHMGELKHMDAENWREVCAQFRGLFLRPDEFKFTERSSSSTTPRPSPTCSRSGPATSTPARRPSWASPSCASWSG